MGLRKVRVLKYLIWVTVFLLMSLDPLLAAKKSWSPVQVDVWDPPFNKELKRDQKTYTALVRAEKKWRIQVFIPHLKDAYWLGVNYGLIDQARTMGVGLTIHQAGGYGQLEVQRNQISGLLKKKGPKPDGVIICSISQDGLNDLVEKLMDQGIPVLDLINGNSSPRLAARVAVSYHDTGYAAGAYLLKYQQKLGKPLSVGWFPGPDGAGWAAAGDVGFREALAGSAIRILASRKGDTGSAAQKQLVTSALKNFPGQLDIIVGTTVTAEVSIGILRKMGLKKKIGVLAYYYSPGVHRGIRRGDIMAAPSDHQVLQARLAIDTLVRIIEKKTYDKHIAPRVTVVDRSNIRKWDSSTTLAPRGFRPVFSINE